MRRPTNIEAAKAVADAICTSLGPRGMDMGKLSGRAAGVMCCELAHGAARPAPPEGLQLSV